MPDDSAPASKLDIQMLMEFIGKSYDAMEAWKEDLEEKIAASEERVKRHFDLTVETIRHDLQGSHRDEIEVAQGSKRRSGKRHHLT